MDDLEWVKDVKPRPPLRVGTCLTFKHSKEEEEWVEDEYGNMIDHGKMNWHITSKFIDVYNDDKPTFSMVATDRMGESRQIFMEVEKVKELYEEGVYEPCKKQPYLKRVMKEESDDFDWISDTNPSRSDKMVFIRKHILDNYETTLTYGNDVKVGDQFLPTNSDTIWTVENIKKDKDNPSRKHPSYFVKLRDGFGKTRREGWHPQPFTNVTKERHKDNGLPGTFPRMNMYKWRKILTKPNLNESDGLQWIKDIEVEKFNKSKSYAVDVSHLRPDTPISISPTSPEYTDLTRVDILDKLKAIGYNVDEITVYDAAYLYVEPSDDAGYWDDDVWVSQGYWVDYNMGDVKDPTYGGRYEMISVDELMFLLDNNMIE